MDYSRPTLADRLAADYVMGTLQGPARRRFDTLLRAHPALSRAVFEWQTRLGVLSADVSPVEPSAGVWKGIEQKLFGAATSPASSHVTKAWRWWQSLWLWLWQGVAATATMAALALSLLISQPLPMSPPLVVVLNSTGEGLQQASATASAQFVASISADGKSLVLSPVAGASVTAKQALELWALPANGAAPRSLGLVASNQATLIQRASLLEGTAAYAVSIEPSGGSPTGKPTGPVISVGKLTI
jgi:anti-sigma-K factor RskA